MTKVHLEHAAFLGARVHLGFEEAESGAAVGLCPVERQVGILEEPVGRRVAIGRGRDADADRHVDPLPVQIDGLIDRVRQPPRERRGVFGIRQVRDDDPELVAPETGDGVGVPQARPQPRRDAFEKVVARGMAEGVVHVFEVVEVEAHESSRRVPLSRPVEGFLDALLKKHAIGQVGQHVMIGEMPDFPLAALQFADIGVENDRSFLGSMLVHQKPAIAVELALEHAVRIRVFFQPLTVHLV